MNPGTMSEWPRFGFEEFDWNPATDVKDSFSPISAARGVYRASIVPEIRARSIPAEAATLAAAADATAELVRFDTEYGSDAGVKALLLHAESAANSSIEIVTSDALSVCWAQIEDRHQPYANQIAALIKANDDALRNASTISDELFLRVQHSMRSFTASSSERWRTQQKWIGGSHLNPLAASFVPPHPRRVGAAMDDLIAFMRRDDLPALPHVAIAHAQYESIQPFLEYNGRTGRVLAQTMLRRRDVLRRVCVPLSAGLHQGTTAYFAALTHYHLGEVDPIIRVLTEATFATLANSRNLVDDRDAIRSGWEDRLRSRADSAARRLLDLIEQNPVVNATMLSDKLDVTAPNLHKAIGKLVDAGILTPIGAARRNRVWASYEILNALETFADHARRPR